jgi:acyl carrier protein
MDNPKKPTRPQSETGQQLRKLLAEQIGVELEDISDEDSFSEQLHMSPSDLVDFTEVLEKQGLNVASLDLTQVLTVGDLIEALSSEEEIE